MRHLHDKKKLIYHNKTSLQHLLQNKLNREYFSCDKQKVIFNMYIYGLEHTNKLGNQSVKSCSC